MAKYVVETFYTCTFKITHKLDELSEKKLSDLENRNDGKVQMSLREKTLILKDYTSR